MPFFTGTTASGAAVTADDENWTTLAGDVVSDTTAAFDFGTFERVTYTVLGRVISDTTGISATGTGNNNHTVTVEAGASVWGADIGISLAGHGNRVINNGTVSGVDNEGILLSGSNGEILNNGLISAALGVSLNTNNQLINTGDIQGESAAVDLSSDRNTVTNFGTMLSDGNAIFISSGSNTITNHGYIGTTSAHDPFAPKFAIKNASGSITITNHGTIDGGILAQSGSGNDVFDAAGGTLIGDLSLGGGDDLVIMRQSNPGDLLKYDGGVGSDTIDLSGFQSGIWLDFSYGGTTIWTQDDNNGTDNAGGLWREFATTENVENAIGTIGIDLMRGNAEDNTFGYVGTALITGVEKIIGLGGSDTVDFSRFASAIRVDLLLAGTEAQTQDDDDVNTGGEPLREIADLEGIENIVGTVGVDYLRGNAEDNTFGYLGDASKVGTEQILGEGGTDTADFSRFESGVWVNLAFAGIEAWTQDDDDASTDVNAGTWREIANLDSIENITGTDESDFLGGDGGANIITAGGGSDRMIGAGGADTFVFFSDPTLSGNQYNTILDFSSDDAEKIDLSGVSEITDFNDLLTGGHIIDNGGTLQIVDGFGFSLDLTGYTTADIALFGQPLSGADFIF